MTEIDLNDLKVANIFALVYGDSGTGKTHLIGTLGKLGKVLVIDVDKGSLTLKHAKDLRPYVPNLTVVSFDKFGDLDNAYKLIKANDPKRWATIGITVDEPFDWVVWDSWSELQWHMLQELRSKDSDMRGSGLNFRKNVQIQHWGMMTDLNKLAIESFRDCEVNQVFIMLETMVKDEISGQTSGGPAIHGKLVQEMPGFFNIVARTYADLQGNYCATTKPKGKWPAKTRIGVGQEYKNPTAEQLFTPQ